MFKKQITKAILGIMLPLTCVVAGERSYELVPSPMHAHRFTQSNTVSNGDTTIANSNLVAAQPSDQTGQDDQMHTHATDAEANRALDGGTSRYPYRKYAVRTAYLVPFVIIIAYGSFELNELAVKYGHLRTEYCHANYLATDQYCMDLPCLPKQNLTVAGYEACYINQEFCWNNGDNIYSICLNEICQNTQLLCNAYKKYYSHKKSDYIDDDYRKDIYFYQQEGLEWVVGVCISCVIVATAAAVKAVNY